MGTTEQQASVPRLHGGKPAAPRALGPLLGALTLAAGTFAYLVYLNWYLIGYPVVQPIRDRIAQRLEDYRFARRLAMDPALGARLRDFPGAEGNAPGARSLLGASVIAF